MSMKISDRAKLLASRTALLAHLESTGKNLKSQLKEYKPTSPDYQKQLLKKYVEFQTDLRELKSLITRKQEALKQKTKDPTLPDFSLEDIHQELRRITDQFRKFLDTNGFPAMK